MKNIINILLLLFLTNVLLASAPRIYFKEQNLKCEILVQSTSGDIVWVPGNKTQCAIGNSFCLPDECDVIYVREK